MAKKKTSAVKIEPFVISPDDPLAAEQAAVSLWVEEAVNKRKGPSCYTAFNLKSLPSGEVLLSGNAEQSLRYVRAAIPQIRHWEQQQSDNERFYGSPDWSAVQCRQTQAMGVLGALLKRRLPFREDDLLTLLEWLSSVSQFDFHFTPMGPVLTTLKRYFSLHQASEELRSRLKQFVRHLNSISGRDARKVSLKVEQLLATGNDDPSVSVADLPPEPPPVPAPAGMPGVLVRLKHRLLMLRTEELQKTMLLEPDQFPLPDNSPLQKEHKLLSKSMAEIYQNSDDPTAECQKFLKQPIKERGLLLLATLERHINSLLPEESDPEQESQHWLTRYAAEAVISVLRDNDFYLERAGLFDLLLFYSLNSKHDQIDNLLSTIAQAAEESPLTEGERFVLFLYRASLVSSPLLGNLTEKVMALTRLIKDGASFYLIPGEVWTDTLNADISRLEAPQRTAWIALLQHTLSATSSRPSGKWLKTATQLLEAIGKEQVAEKFLHWFPLVQQGRSLFRMGNYAGDTRGTSDTIHPENADCLRGLLWCVPLLPRQEELIRSVTSLALFSYKKIPGIGPRAVKVGNAAIYTLSELGTEAAVGQLAMLKLRVKFGTAQKEIEKAFDAAARALGLPRDQIEELGVPSYGLEGVGRACTELGGYRAELQVTGANAQLQWFDANGKALKSVPAKIKSEFKEDLKELQQSLKDIQAMLPAQRDRIDGLFLLQKSWLISEWQERYLQHPLVGTIAQRLVWCIDETPALFNTGKPTDLQGNPVEHGKTSEVTLWHPVGRSIDEILAWRRRVEELGITQPFKQVYREVYPLTDAERNTRTYSNRFAAHIIRQHQFNALCAARGWKNKLRLLVDDAYPPASKELSHWGLRAEFWVEGIGDNYGVDTNDSGTFLRLVTDQVRFYRTEAAINYVHASGGGYESAAADPGQNNINAPLPLDEVPALVFSEIMRDVDLFVGVASVGNDPTWQDGGPEGRYRDYWQSYSFGELSGTATTRKQVLERLVPRLKIASRCSFSDRFLVVQGDKRTYKIHLGSGNILMEPNDQYLCIVPDTRARAAQGEVYLPFEGDATLSIIISKALLLAEDTKIKDATITRQIELRI